MCVSYEGGRTGFVPLIPALAADETEPFRIRPATPEDAPFITRVAEHGAERYLLTCVRDEALWRYEIEGRSPGSMTDRALCIIETAAGEPAGYLAHARRLVQWQLSVFAYELAPSVSWLDATSSVLRYIGAAGRE